MPEKSNQNALESGARFAARQLADWGLTAVFAVPGADVGPFVAALEDEPHVDPSFAAHEFSAGAMADGYSRVAGKPAVAVAIGGPGAANLAAAAAAASRDGSVLLYITGNPPGQPDEMRALDSWPDDCRLFSASGVQCVDIPASGGLHPALKEVMEVLASGRSAHLQFPLDEQHATAPASSTIGGEWRLREPPSWTPTRHTFDGRVAFAVGKSALSHGAEIAQLAKAARIPVLTDMLARGVIDEHEDLALGHLGFMPHPRARAVSDPDNELRADRIIAFGSDGGLIARLQKAGVPTRTIATGQLTDWLDEARQLDVHRSAERMSWIAALESLDHPNPTPTQLDHDQLVEQLAAWAPANAIHVVDAGQFHLSGPVRLLSSRPRSIITGSELVSMGWSIGAAIGAQRAAPDRQVIAYLGDGSFLMHGLELATAARYEVPVLFVVAFNRALRSVQLKSRPGHSAHEIGPIDPVAVAEACGVASTTVSSLDDLRSTLRRNPMATQPHLLCVDIDQAGPTADSPHTGIAWLDGTPG